MRRLRPALCALTIFLEFSPAAAQRVIDGDTLSIGGQSVRLYGMDAPELHQTCDGGRWAPGPLARKDNPRSRYIVSSKSRSEYRLGSTVHRPTFH